MIGGLFVGLLRKKGNEVCMRRRILYLCFSAAASSSHSSFFGWLVAAQAALAGWLLLSLSSVFLRRTSLNRFLAYLQPREDTGWRDGQKNGGNDYDVSVLSGGQMRWRRLR